jgi:NAD(P)-dependent dehydrogenase (short-subunit alcohol dehydrogenase family)
VVKEIEDRGGRARFVPVELDGSMRASQQLATDARDAFGEPIEVLVNSAGIFPGSTTPTVDEAMFDEVYAVNVKAPFFLTAVIAPEMNARGSGSIINLGSWVARLGIPVGALYASTKGAIETLTRAWAAEFGSPGVRVNAISPGVVRTLTENDPAAAMMHGTPYGAFGTPDAIAHAAVYLGSEESRFVNGTVIDVDGGRTGVAVIAG